MIPARILVVDDDTHLLELIKIRLEAVPYEVIPACSAEKAIEAAREKLPDLSLLDLQLGNESGISLMQQIHTLLPEMPVIIITGYGSVESAVEAMQKGAYSYLTKPVDHRDLLLQIERGLEKTRLTSEIKRLHVLLDERYDFPNIVARSDRMQEVLALVARIAKTESTVFIQGESGTGKELIAKAIHHASPRKEGPFVAINCAALPETLLESELFGYEKGAFTGAVQSKKGLFTQAHGGVFFLDEIGDMPLSTQAKLLRVLQERQFYPVGGEKPIDVDVRLIVATNKDLEAQVKEGLFRDDLFYRIHVIPVYLPPLRERKEDIPPLVKHFVKKFSLQMKKEVEDLTPGALQKLMLYDWPGNVRELENTMEFAVAMTQHDVIAEDLVLQTKAIVSQDPFKPLKKAKDDFERVYLIRLLEICEGNVSKAAKLAGKHRADFYDLLKKHDLKTGDYKKPA